ncbi:hypothetical protein OM076_41150 [Solirubrobacter ginsenosidimutans]|uniref:PNPLA domain-containing protein n=1 Tax=Solirubrobacter ginsenosidimutans TaxID=490573 RepID=A0A9X3S882_9ACTN|nr:hypothetical protein [Solirubrobacter ginsenosidimutans]MDA0166741.1 hypothetical protein [Solirubrobacter ginsenosidimutans]
MSDTEATLERADQGMLDHVGGWGRTKRSGGARRRWLLYGVREEPTPGYTGLYEAPHDGIGVCCSGGGIRSAAFNLGALQVVLADTQTRGDVKYLSAVSGGSYIAAAFCMIAKRWSGTPNADDSDPRLVTDHAPPFHPGSPEELYLRNHLGYLAPDGTAKLYLGLRMVAGLTVNVLLIGLPVLILGLVAGLLANGPYQHLEDGTFHLPLGPLLAVVSVAGLSLTLAMLDVLWRPKKERLRAFARTWEVRLFVLACALATLFIVVPALAAWAASLGTDNSATSAVQGSIGTALSSMGALALAAISHVRGQVKDKQKALANAERKLGKYAKPVRDAVIAVVVTLAGPILLLAIAVLGVLVAVGDTATGQTVLILAAIARIAMWISIDLTTVSLHPFYRRRLSTAFALRRVWHDENGDEARAPSEDDQVEANGKAIAEERPFDTMVELSESHIAPPEPDADPAKSLSRWPMLIVCAAANVSDPGATPPGRAVASFTFSPTAVGGPLTGATETKVYEQLGRNRRRDVTLPAAVAMSGAALSPSMGKLTYRPLSFLLALANIRLGVWVPNPRHVNEENKKTGGDKIESLAPRGRDKVSLRHRPRPEYLWKELWGRNRLDDKFLYVSDGGHYENLGLVELLRRGCRTIYCFDAGGGSTTNALGDAIALARTELNIEIDMDEHTKLLAESKTPPLRAKAACAKGTVRYPRDATPGRLIYVRSVVTEDSPWDLANYQEEDGVFPHHSTLDQFFDDRRFEAYRRLGGCAANSALAIATAEAATTNGAARVEQAKRDGATGTVTLEADER